MEIHKEIRRKIRKNKKNWLPEKCEEIEQCEKKYDYDINLIMNMVIINNLE